MISWGMTEIGRRTVTKGTEFSGNRHIIPCTFVPNSAPIGTELRYMAQERLSRCTVVLNLPGDMGYDPTQLSIFKITKAGMMAADLVIYILDDCRETANSLKEAWLASSRVAKTLAWFISSSLQDFKLTEIRFRALLKVTRNKIPASSPFATIGLRARLQGSLKSFRRK
jgi:hypothetical protein